LGHMLTALGRWQEAELAFGASSVHPASASATLAANITRFQATLMQGLMQELLGQTSKAQVSYAKGLSQLPFPLAHREVRQMLGEQAGDSNASGEELSTEPNNRTNNSNNTTTNSNSNNTSNSSCKRDELPCWDALQRRRAAKWPEENLCEGVDDSVLAEPCAVFDLRRWLIFARLAAAQRGIQRAHREQAQQQVQTATAPSLLQEAAEASNGNNNKNNNNNNDNNKKKKNNNNNDNNNDNNKDKDKKNNNNNDKNDRYPWERCFQSKLQEELSVAVSDFTIVPGQEAQAKQLLATWGVVRRLPGRRQSLGGSSQEMESEEGQGPEYDGPPDPAPLIAHLLRSSAGDGPQASQYVHMARNRHHMRLRPGHSAPITTALAWLATLAQEMLPFGAGGSSGIVVEMGAFVTNPGAKPQRWHSDFQHPGCRYCAGASHCGSGDGDTDAPTKTACGPCLESVASPAPGDAAMPVYSCQLLLTTESDRAGRSGSTTGGLEVMPGTHELAGGWMAPLASGRSSPPDPQFSLSGPPGTVFCYDGTLRHRGGGYPDISGPGNTTANHQLGTSGRLEVNFSSRVVVYLSAAGPGAPVLPGTAMSPELVGLKLAELAELSENSLAGRAATPSAGSLGRRVEL
ncbi:unnamed protein product, partial [Polarella glacialis]